MIFFRIVQNITFLFFAFINHELYSMVNKSESITIEFTDDNNNTKKYSNLILNESEVIKNMTKDINTANEIIPIIKLSMKEFDSVYASMKNIHETQRLPDDTMDNMDNLVNQLHIADYLEIKTLLDPLEKYISKKYFLLDVQEQKQFLETTLKKLSNDPREKILRVTQYKDPILQEITLPPSLNLLTPLPSSDKSDIYKDFKFEFDKQENTNIVYFNDQKLGPTRCKTQKEHFDSYSLLSPNKKYLFLKLNTTGYLINLHNKNSIALSTDALHYSWIPHQFNSDSTLLLINECTISINTKHRVPQEEYNYKNKIINTNTGTIEFDNNANKSQKIFFCANNKLFIQYYISNSSNKLIKIIDITDVYKNYEYNDVIQYKFNNSLDMLVLQREKGIITIINIPTGKRVNVTLDDQKAKNIDINFNNNKYITLFQHQKNNALDHKKTFITYNIQKSEVSQVAFTNCPDLICELSASGKYLVHSHKNDKKQTIINALTVDTSVVLAERTYGTFQLNPMLDIVYILDSSNTWFAPLAIYDLNNKRQLAYYPATNFSYFQSPLSQLSSNAISLLIFNAEDDNNQKYQLINTATGSLIKEWPSQTYHIEIKGNQIHLWNKKNAFETYGSKPADIIYELTTTIDSNNKSIIQSDPLRTYKYMLMLSGATFTALILLFLVTRK
ncbi:MAG TPA: hypothetical protein VLB80_05130 [Candidatus Babeliales bacterium]|nr:hypothetical protein [Candidatus Babeliales bacterium]